MADPASRHQEKVLAHVEQSLKTDRRKAKTRPELIALYKRFYKIESHRIRMQHRAGAGGLEIARRRADLLDLVLHNLFAETLESGTTESGSKKSTHPFTLVAVGGYGRGTLNPGSDVDLLFLCPENATALPAPTVEMITEIITMLFDVGLKVGHATRSIKECIGQANADNPTKTAMLDARFITGDAALYATLEERFRKDCIEGKEREYLEVRRRDFLSRHKKHRNTVYLQEPNIKEGCGGMRDYQNILWVIEVKFGAEDLEYLVENKLLTKTAHRAMTNAYDFLMRVRNELHWAERPCTDQLTLRLQGVVATNLGYPQDTILRRIEVFMRDYYRHTRAIHMHSTSLMQAFHLLEEKEKTGIIPFLARRADKEEHFDGFYAKNNLIYPERSDIFTEDPSRMMRTFQHTQRRHLCLSPEIRKLFKRSYPLVDNTFRYATANRDTFEEILSARGDVGRVLRQMHRVGFLGKYLPEFGELDCLVQHEFFHRYTADEHTLRCLDILDQLTSSTDPRLKQLRQLCLKLEDPFVIYLALILHDTGRAENKRYHTDASMIMTTRVCSRLQIKGEQRRLLLFLVDNHLTLWKTATSKNLDDPETIREFAAVMQNRSYMETLLVMTYADSSATNEEEGWTSWKELLMFQLYRATTAFMEDAGAFDRHLVEAKSETRNEIEPLFDEDHAEEVDAHFELLPSHYFQFRGAESVARHIKLFRRYIQHNVTTEGLACLHPVLEWIDHPDRGYTQLELCCWDRTNLLAKVAGALASEEINILSADIFTRGDDLVLDLFKICTTNFEPVKSTRVRQRVEQLLSELLDAGEDWTRVAEQIPSTRFPDESLAIGFPSRVLITNHPKARHTTVEVQGLDRLGLLFDIFTAIGRLNLEVAVARILTEKGAAIDTFQITDFLGRKVTDEDVLDQLQTELEMAVGVIDAEVVNPEAFPAVSAIVMVRILHQLIFRYLLRHKLVACLDILGIAIGVSVYLAIQASNVSASRAFRSSIDLTSGKSHLEVRGRGKGVEETLFPRLSRHEAVRAATPVVEGYVTLPDFPGRYLHLTGIDPFTSPPFQTIGTVAASHEGLQLESWLGRPGQVLLHEGLARDLGLHPGDVFRVERDSENRTLTVAGLLPAQELGREAADAIAVMDVGWAQEFLGHAGTLTSIQLLLHAPDEAAATRNLLQEELGRAVQVQAPRMRSLQVQRMLSGFQLNITALSMVSVLVGVFLIYSTVSASVVRRRREIGILRSNGASPRQIFGVFLVEGLLLGIPGVALGIPFGLALAQGLVGAVSQTISSHYILIQVATAVVPPIHLVLATCFGLGASLVGAFLPALKAARIPPLEALRPYRHAHTSQHPSPARRALLLAGLLTLGLAALASAAALGAGPAWLSFLACFLLVTGFALATPALCAGLARCFGFALRHKPRWVLGRIAVDNFGRSLHQTAITVAALMTALAMTIGVSVMVSSFRGTVQSWVHQVMKADLFVTPAANEVIGFQSFLPPEVIDRARSHPAVEKVETYRQTAMVIPGADPFVLAAVGNAATDTLMFIGGDRTRKMALFQRPGHALATEPLARRLGLTEGDTLTVPSPSGPVPLIVAGIYHDYTDDRGKLVITRESFSRHWQDDRVHSLAIFLHPESAATDVRQDLEVSTETYALAWLSNDELRTRVFEVFDQTFAVTYVLRTVSVVVAILGVSLALATLVMERTREIGILRAAGGSRQQIERLFLVEASVIGLASSGIGILCGLGMSMILTWVVNKAFFGWTIQLRIPWGEIAGTPLWVIPAAVVAALIPAAQAARLPVHAAVRTE